MRRTLNDSIQIQMTVRLALSLLAFGATTAAGAVTWAYSFQQHIVDMTDQRREMRLQAFPSSLQLQQIILDLENKQETQYRDLRDRIDAVRSLIVQQR